MIADLTPEQYDAMLAGAKPGATIYQIDKLREMFRRNRAEMDAIKAAYPKVDRHRVVKLRKAVKVAQRLEQKLGIRTPAEFPAHENGDGV